MKTSSSATDTFVENGHFKILDVDKLLPAVCPNAKRVDNVRGRLKDYQFTNTEGNTWHHPKFFSGSTAFVNIKSRRSLLRSARARVAAQPRPSLPRQVTTVKRKLNERSGLTVKEYEAKRRKENKGLGQWQAEVEAELEELKADAARTHAVNMASFTTLSNGVKHNTTKVCQMQQVLRLLASSPYISVPLMRACYTIYTCALLTAVDREADNLLCTYIHITHTQLCPITHHRSTHWRSGSSPSTMRPKRA